MSKIRIKEDPDTVFDNDRNHTALARCGEEDIPNVAFIVYRINGKVEYSYDEERYQEKKDSWHSGCRRNAYKKFGDNVPLDEIFQGRFWPEKKIASTYQQESTVMSHASVVERMFNDLGEDISEYRWDFGGDSYENGLKPWKKSTIPAEKEMDAETKKQIDDLIQQIHVATPENKSKIRQQIRALQNAAGISDDLITMMVKNSYAKQASQQGDYGSVAQANYMKGAIAEIKLRISNKTLDTNLWNENMALKPEIRAKLLQVAQDFYKNTELKTNLIDILMIGSSANYNWTPTSDLDLHLVIDVTKENIPTEHQRAFLDGLGAKWNNNHEIEIKGHPLEIYLQDIREKNSTAALARKGASIYSVLKNTWVKKPDSSKPEIDVNKIKEKYKKVKSMIDDFVSEKDVDKLKKLMKAIRNYRDAGLEAGGEFGTENLVFKALRRTGDLEKLKTSINTLYDQSASVKELKKKA